MHKATTQEIVQLYGDYFSTKAIAKKLNVSASFVFETLKRAHVVMRPCGSRGRNDVLHQPDGTSVIKIKYKKEVLDCVIDTEDYRNVENHHWRARKTKWGGVYAACEVKLPSGSYLTVGMHMLLCGFGADHKDRNGLNNRRNNLRLATAAQQSANTSKQENGRTSKFKGVSFDKWTNRFAAQISANNKRFHLGRFPNTPEGEVAAAKAYDAAALKFHGQFAVLNFPEESVVPRNL